MFKNAIFIRIRLWLWITNTFPMKSIRRKTGIIFMKIFEKRGLELLLKQIQPDGQTVLDYQDVDPR